MIAAVLCAAVLLGSICVALALWYLRGEKQSEFSKALSDLFLKLAIVIFGVSIGLIGFFAQKWLEDTNQQIQEANEALGNLDIIYSQYVGEVETAYFNNDS